MGAGASKIPQGRPGLVVTLDALGTLYRFREPITTQYIKVAGRCGLTAKIEDDDLKKAFKQSFKDISAEYPNYGKGQLKSARAWWKTLVNDAFRQLVHETDIPDHLGDELYDHFTSSAAYELFPDVKPFFSTMREIKHQFSKPEDAPFCVGVISNSDPRVKRVLQSLGLRVGAERMPTIETVRERLERSGTDVENIVKSPWHDLYNPLNDIDFLATSYEANAEKPSEAIFRFATTLSMAVYSSKLEHSRDDWKPSMAAMRDKLRVAKQTASIADSKFIHIGDDYDKDYVGARVHGWDSILLKREDDDTDISSKATSPNIDASTVKVTNLEEAAATIRILAQDYLGKSDG